MQIWLASGATDLPQDAAGGDDAAADGMVFQGAPHGRRSACAKLLLRCLAGVNQVHNFVTLERRATQCEGHDASRLAAQ
jgi:hypothetical protein